MEKVIEIYENISVPSLPELDFEMKLKIIGGAVIGFSLIYCG